MEPNLREEQLNNLFQSIKQLSDGQIGFIEPVISILLKPYFEISHLPKSDLVNDCILENMGDAIRIHHAFSNGPFTKDKFEYAMCDVFNLCGKKAELAPQGNPGYDINIEGQKMSLKTEAEASIRLDRIHVSKAMELGKGEWELELLRNQYLNHLAKYERILTLRCVSKPPPFYHYELVEIPKALLLECARGKLYFVDKSRQEPKPGYCDITDEKGNIKFQLYFDAGGERKLQIKNLQKKYCLVHADWIFSADKNPDYIQKKLI
jgi:hypothetical protein